MGALEKIIGYESIKEELKQICDMFKNKEKYQSMGAALPKGVLIYGDHGVGKTFMVKCLLEECGVDSYLIDKSTTPYELAEDLSSIFAEAKESAPAIIFIDDLDSYESCYDKLQAEIDKCADADVLFIATIDEEDSLPASLLSIGRFCKKIEVKSPSDRDLYEIINHYLADKPVAKDLSIEDLAMMLSDRPCAEVKAIINEAAINAGFSGEKEITINDFVKVCLRENYTSPDIYTCVSDSEVRRIAIHEAGHLVINEVLRPGSVGLASVRTDGRDCLNGFVWKCKALPKRTHNILANLGGKVAEELYYSETCASGCYSDLRKAVHQLRLGIMDNGTCGLGMLDVSIDDMSESTKTRNEAVIYAQMETYIFKTRNILLNNREFLEKAADLLVEKKVLLYSDIKKLKESLTITQTGI